MRDLFLIWQQTMRHLGHAEHRGLFDELLARYQEPQRHYHTIAHLSDCLAKYQRFVHEMNDPAAVALALFYHDSVYDVHRTDNEQMSVVLWRAHAYIMGGSEVLVEKVSEMILATKHHQAQEGDTQFLLDIDLSILGEPKQVFDRFEREIREEYAWVPEEMYRSRRKAILSMFLERQAIFYTRSFCSYEGRARENLKQGIEALGSRE